MNTQNISAVVVGADRVTANGDTANKIGTYQVTVCVMVFFVTIICYIYIFVFICVKAN